MHKKESVDQTMLADGNMNRLAYLGTNTMRYILNLYYLQRMVETVKFQKNEKLATSDIKRFIGEDAILGHKIRELRIMLHEEECKPPLTECRDFNWFMKGDQVICYVPGNKKVFIKARIYATNIMLCDGSRAVSVRYRKPLENGYFMSGYNGLYSISDPYILKIWEYKYLLHNQEFAHVWIKQSMQKQYSLQESVAFSQAL